LIIGVACFVALLALLSVVMPRTADRCKAVVSRWPVQAFAAGLVTFAVGGSLAYFFLTRGYIPRLLRVEVVPGMLGAGLALVAVALALQQLVLAEVARGDRPAGRAWIPASHSQRTGTHVPTRSPDRRAA
jgi:hypothetical protein